MPKHAEGRGIHEYYDSGANAFCNFDSKEISTTMRLMVEKPMAGGLKAMPLCQKCYDAGYR